MDPISYRVLFVFYIFYLKRTYSFQIVWVKLFLPRNPYVPFQTLASNMN